MFTVSHRKVLVAIVLLSVVLRLAAAFYLGDQVVDLPGTYDQVSYHALALRVLQGHGFSFASDWWPATSAGAPTAHWSYLYTLYLTLIYSLFGVHPLVARLIQAALVGALQPFLTYLIGARVFNPRVALVAAGINAIYIYFIYYAGTLMTEPFYITAILAAMYLSFRIIDLKKGELPKSAAVEGKPISRVLPNNVWLGLGLGLALAVAVLLRQLFLFIIPFLFLWIWFINRKRTGSLIIAAAVIGVIILPFTIFNYLRFNRFVLLNTNAGYAFFWANHPVYGTQFEHLRGYETYLQMIPPELLSLDEAALDQALLRRGLQFVLDDPGRYILLSISRIPAYFMFWPSSQSGTISNLSRVGSFGIFLPFMLYGLVGTWLQRPKPLRQLITSPLILLYGFILLYTAIHLLSWALIRYRLPVDAILVLFASWAIVDLAQRLRIFPQ